jgi:membrane protease YdiL (CAAX protease family)
MDGVSTRVEADRASRPGWLELAVALVVFAVVGFGGAVAILGSGLAPAARGVILAAWSGVAGLAGFAAVVALGRRPLAALGLRSTSARWWVIGAGWGLFAFLVKGVAVMGFSALTGPAANPQAVYAGGASGGWIATLIATLGLGVLTPIGEELVFRGVVTNALLRYGPGIGVGVGALVFAVFHGVNIVFPAALVAGLVAGELFRRSRSVWPAVMVHVVFNVPTIPIMLLAAAGAPS